MQDGTGKLVFTVTWEVREGAEAKAADIITRFTPEARKEPGVELLMVARNAGNPRQFLFYEVFADEQAFAAHQETPHFRQMIVEEALPLLSHRERVRYVAV
jgi:quinol monooxygenase YgiN